MIKLMPREKLAESGPEALEDHELLSVIIGRGTQKESVFQIAQRLFANFDREEMMTEKSLQQFQQKFHLPPVRAAQIMACVELGKRLFQKPSSMRQIKTVDDLYQIVMNMRFLKKEYVRGLYVNTRNRIIHDEVISIGSLDANILHPREIFRPAIEYGAYAIIIAHNHPSGDPQPSPSDLKVTQKLSQIAQLLQIPLLDHIIVGEEGYFSFNRENLFKDA